MDQSVHYAQAMSNFDSVYNVPHKLVHHSTTYMPMSSSSSYRNRSISPSLTSSNPKFNLDLYNPNEYHSESIDYPSPSSSVIIHHYPVYSPPPSPPSQSISKLRQINNELSHTLAQCELTINRSQSSSLPPPPSQYHIHHYPISYETYRSRSPSEQTLSSSSSIEQSEPIKRKHNARITYKAHIPRRQKSLSNLDQVLISTSDAYLSNDPMTIDLYPTRDQGLVKKIRNRPNNQSPWLSDTSPIRRNSFSEASTYRTPRGPYYGDKPIQPKSRLASGKERPRSSSVNPRVRPDSAPNPLRQSAISFSKTAPVWRPNGSIKPTKFIGSHAPPSILKPPPHEAPWNPAGVASKTQRIRAFDPVSKALPPKTPESVWRPSSKSLNDKRPKYFEPTVKPELIVPINKSTEPVLKSKKLKTHKKVSSADPTLKTRIAKAESKVKSAWEATATVKEPKPPIPRSVKKTATTTTIPVKPKVKDVPSQPSVPVKKIVSAPPTTTDTGRSSLNNISRKPMYQSTPKNQSMADEDDGSVADLFENESQVSEVSKKQVIPHPPPQIEKTPTKTPNTIVPGSVEKSQSVIKNDVLIHGDDADNIRDDNPTPSPHSEINNNDNKDEDTLNNHSVQPSPIPPERKASSPKPDTRDDVSIVEDEDAIPPAESDQDDTHENVDASFEMNKSLDNIPKAITNVKSAWEATATVKEPKPPIPRSVKKTATTTTIPVKPKVKDVPSQPSVPVKKIVSAPPTTTDTGRSSLNNISRKPMYQSTPKNQSMADEDDGSVVDLFENESQVSEVSKKQVIPHPPPQIEKTPTKNPNTIVPGSVEKSQSVIKNDVLIHGDDADNIRDDNPTPSPHSEINNNDNKDEDTLNNHSVQPSPIPPERKASPPKPDNRDDVSIVEDEDAILPAESDQDDTHENVDASFEMNKSLDNIPKAITNGSKKDDIISPLASPRTSPKANIKTPPHRKQPSPAPPSENLDENSYQSPISTKKNDHKLPKTPSPPPSATADVDDFFD
ncbi:unnamed protein product [Rotaria sp. Silwood1]|nr:unnamed protein product [Rotaria sp. Silwood1]